MEEILHKSCGILRYVPRKLIVEVDPEIVEYYRHWLQVTLNRQMYAPHISVVRKEEPPHMGFWGKYEGELVEFEYSHIVQSGSVYYWLNCYSQRLIDIRLELGLPAATSLTRPPDGEWCFHCTIGNTKGL